MTPPKYDNNEYALLAQLSTHSQFLLDDCSDADAARDRLVDMQYAAANLTTYAFYLPDNEEFFQISAVINNDVTQFSAKYADGEAPSVKYCELKTKILLEKIDSAMTAMGKLDG